MIRPMGRIRWRVETGFRAPFMFCGHRHRSHLAARICAERAASRLPHDAVRLVAIDDLSIVVHVEHYTRQRVAGEPWNPDAVERDMPNVPAVRP